MAASIQVEVVYVSASGENWRRTLMVAEGTSVSEAIELSGAPQYIRDYNWQQPAVAVFGQRVDCPEQMPVKPGDQIEICRPLLADPKLRRKSRAAS